MRMPDSQEPSDRDGCRLVQRRLCGHHRIEQGQSQRDTGATQERAAGDELLGDKHLRGLLQPVRHQLPALRSTSLVLISNGALLIMPIRIDRNLSLSLSASCTIERITGISSYSTPRPRLKVINFS